MWSPELVAETDVEPGYRESERSLPVQVIEHS
jgi:hypothetical protein